MSLCLFYMGWLNLVPHVYAFIVALHYLPIDLVPHAYAIIVG